MNPRILLLVGLATLAAACGTNPSEPGIKAKTRESVAFEEAEAAKRRAWLEEMKRNAPRPAILRPRLLKAATSELRSTIVVPHPSAALPAGKNALWCATFSLAWDSLSRDVNGAPLELGTPAPADLAKRMDREPFPREALDSSAYLARAGRVRDGIVLTVANELKERFGAEMLPAPDIPSDGAVAYGYLRKSLPFPVPFEPALRVLRFPGGSKAVAAFGINPDTTNPDEGALRSQVMVHHSKSPLHADEVEEFVLEFTVKGGRDRLLLAVVPPGESLAETWQGVRATLGDGRHAALGGGATLVVPKMNLDLDHRFQEFLGAGISGGALAGQPIAEARQTIRFSLDEGGAELESHAILETAGKAPPSYVVDRPFLLALVQKDAKEPYLLLWIANDELLAAAE